MPYIQEGFAKQGKHISEQLIEQLCESFDYQSSYVQQLAYNTLLPTEKEVTDDILKTALNDLVDQNSIVYIDQTQSLTSYQLKFLRAVLAGQSTNFGKKDLMGKIRLWLTIECRSTKERSDSQRVDSANRERLHHRRPRFEALAEACFVSNQSV